ncbi:MAG: YczE/YyaS/YitT family protein [Acidimicrobiia bacterium]
MISSRPGGMFIRAPWAVVRARFPRLLLGLFLFGAGSALQVQANLGLSPWEVLHQGIAARTPLSIGVASIGVSLLVLLLWIPLRQRLGVGTVTNAITIGLFIDLVLFLVPQPAGLAGRWSMLIVGILMVGIGSGFYIGVHLGPGPRDGLMTGIARRGLSLRVARTGVEGTALALGWLLGGTVGIGTVLFSLTIGPIVQFFLPRLEVPAES